MHDALPPWTDLSPDDPPGLGPAGGSGRLVAVVATARALGGTWPVQGAIDLCEAWRAQGHKVVLADCGVAEPSLHTVLGVPNAEGVTDAVLFGASPGRVTGAVGDRGLLFIPAGTVTAHVASVFGSPRWASLVQGFRQAGATLVLYLPANEAAESGALAQADDIVLLGVAGEHVPESLGDPALVRALLAPAGEPGLEGEAELPDPLDPLAVDPLSATAEVAGAAPVASTQDPGDETSQPEGRRGLRPRTWALAVVVVASLAVAANRLGLLPMPASTPEPEPTLQEAQPAAQPVTPDPSPPSPIELTGTEQAFSVTLASYRNQEAAQARLQALAPRVTGTLVYTAPLMVDGTPYHRLLLGPAPDSLAALSLADRVATELGTDPANWVVRRTPLAYLIDEVEALDEAEAVAAAWQVRGVVGYVLRVEYSDGRAAHRLYAGAYADETEAVHMGEVLVTAGAAEPRLVSRVGSVVR